MKTIIFSLIIIFGLSACEKQTPPVDEINKNMTMPATNVKNTGTPNKY
jgi:PBP1b-binding outer membrane lipoprotein LpoB